MKEAQEFKRKANVVKAIQWTGTNLIDVIEFTELHASVKDKGWGWSEYTDIVAKEGLKIFTLEGAMKADIGDWVVQGFTEAKGHHYWPVKPDYFALNYEPASQPSAPTEATSGVRIVCYCGSLRKAKEAFQKAEYESLMKGEIALLPCCMFVDIEREYGAGSDYKTKADENHKRKIDICDEVFVLNVGGYIGESTRSEIEYAKSIGKPVKYLEL